MQLTSIWRKFRDISTKDERTEINTTPTQTEYNIVNKITF